MGGVQVEQVGRCVCGRVEVEQVCVWACRGRAGVWVWVCGWVTGDCEEAHLLHLSGAKGRVFAFVFLLMQFSCLFHACAGIQYCAGASGKKKSSIVKTIVQVRGGDHGGDCRRLARERGVRRLEGEREKERKRERGKEGKSQTPTQREGPSV